MIGIRNAQACILGLALLTSGASAQDECSYEHTYIGSAPKEKRPGWHYDAQGLTHDDDSWFITHIPSVYKAGRYDIGVDPFPRNCDTGAYCPDPVLWRIPAEHELSKSAACGDPNGPDAGVAPVCVSLDTVAPDLWELGYDHYGDPAFYYFEPDDQGYLCIPLEGGLRPPGGGDVVKSPAALGFFRADDLSFVALATLPDQRNTAAYCAIDDAGFVYSSVASADTRTYEVFKYRVAWERLAEDPPVAEVTRAGSVELLDESGAALGLHKSVQGGEFSGDGRLLYLVNGNEADDCKCGIHVFALTLKKEDEDDPSLRCSAAEGDCVAQRIERSRNGGDPFNYQYNPGFWTYEEPEGLVWWDLEAPGAPSVPGVTTKGTPVAQSQLHVVLLDNEGCPTLQSSGCPTDQVYIKHYQVTSTCEPAPGIDVQPRSMFFEDAPVGATAAAQLIVSNAGDADLEVRDVRLRAGGDPAFGLDSALVLPATIPPSASESIEVRFEPSSEALVEATLEIESDDPDLPVLAVPIAGRGLSFADQAQQLLALFDQGVVDGLLEGTGAGNSAEHRLEALRAMLAEALALLEGGFVAEACGPLQAALLHADGEPEPEDFVTGAASEELADAITALRSNLGCRVRRSGCGIGFELSLFLPPLMWLRRRAAKASSPVA